MSGHAIALIEPTLGLGAAAILGFIDGVHYDAADE
jgi:hypothetical protein